MSRSLWNNRDFTFLWTGQTISQFGTAMTTFVIPWLFLQLTGSATQTGLAFAAGYVPYILVSLPAGVIADRFNRKFLMMSADLVRLTLLLTVVITHMLLGVVALSLLYVVQGGISAASAIFDAAYGASIPNIVERDLLLPANGTLQSSFSLSKIVGPILGGVAVSWLGTTNTLTVDVGSYLVSILSLAAIKTSLSAPTLSVKGFNFFADIREGLSAIMNVVPIRNLMVFSALVNLVGPGIDVALLFRIQHELRLPSQWAGIIMTGLSAGMLIGSVLNRRAGKRFRADRWLAVSTVLQIFPPVVLIWARSPLLITGIQAFVGLLLVAWNIQAVTLRQTLIPNHLLGRCTSVFRLTAWIFIPLGDTLAGWVSERFSAPLYFTFAAGVLAVIAIWTVLTKFQKSIASEWNASVDS